MTLATAERLDTRSPANGSQAIRRLFSWGRREARDRPTATAATRRAFDAELLRQYAQNRLSGSLLISANFEGANLQEADLRFARAIGANFTGADLAGADLANSDFTEAKFKGTKFWGATARRAKAPSGESASSTII